MLIKSIGGGRRIKEKNVIENCSVVSRTEKYLMGSRGRVGQKTYGSTRGEWEVGKWRLM